MLSDLNNKNLNIKSAAQIALKDEEVLSELLENLKCKQETIRYNSAKILLFISEKHPKVLYHRWDYLAELLSAKNTYWLISAISIIANLTRADTENRFEKIFDKYYSILQDKRTIPAMYLVGSSGKIASAKPNLRSKITDILLNIDKIHFGKQIELIKSAAIESFGEYFEDTKDKKKTIEFVEKQLESESPKTRKTAKEFLKKWGK